MLTTIEEPQRAFTATMTRAARADIEGTIDRALKKATGARQNRALAKLRGDALNTLNRIRDGRDPRMPSAVLDEVLVGINRILNGDTKQTIAKAASGPGHRDAAGLREMTREEKVQAFLALAAALKGLVAKWRPLFRRLKAEARLEKWHRGLAADLAELARVGDLTSARFLMDRAGTQIVAMHDEAKFDAALAAK